MSSLWRRLLIVTAIAVAIFAAVSIYVDVGKLGDRLAHFAPAAILAALGLAAMNYVIRFGRWELYLRTVGVAIPRGLSAHVFVAGFSMSITPGKVGELLKAVLLRDAAGVPVETTAPVVIAERVTDLVALVGLGLIGVATYGVAREMVAAAAIVVLLGLIVLSWRPLAHGILDRLAKVNTFSKLVPRARAFYDRLATLVHPWPLTWATLLGAAAWLCECVGFAIVVRGFEGAHVSLGLAMLIYAATTVAGALSFLPGGLLVTEASMTLLLINSADGVDQATAVAATILTRLCTLWFAVLLGVVALAIPRRARAAA
jgi:uncharacterized protein (TIRG00374 family)